MLVLNIIGYASIIGVFISLLIIMLNSYIYKKFKVDVGLKSINALTICVITAIICCIAKLICEFWWNFI